MHSHAYQDAVTALREIATQLRVAGVGIEALEVERGDLEQAVAAYVAAGIEDDNRIANLEAERDMAIELAESRGAHIAELEAQVAALAVRIAELEGTTGELEPPIVVDPPPPTQTNAPDYSEFPFAHLMPAWDPYAKPTEADCDWIVDGIQGRAVSRKGLPSIEFSSSAGVCGELYKRSLAAGHGPRVTLGVRGYVGAANLGGLYSQSGGQAPGDVCARGQNGSWLPQDVQFVGLTPNAEAAITWSGGPSGDSNGPTDRLAVFALGMRGATSNHGWTQNSGIGELILDDFWLLVPPGFPVGGWHAAMHISNWERRLVLRGLKRRGRDIGVNDGMPLPSGHIPYIKSSGRLGSQTHILGCDLRGANQTGVQKRPGTDEPLLTEPRDVTVYADNVCDNHGWDHENPEGGAVISHWSSPHARTFIVRNRARNARYGCLLVSGQPLYTGSAGPMGPLVDWNRNWYNARGYPIGEVYIDGNDFSNLGSGRHAVSINNAEHVVYGPGNRVEGTIALDSQWSPRSPVAPRNGRVILPSNVAPYTFDAALDAERLMTQAEISALAGGATPL